MRLSFFTFPLLLTGLSTRAQDNFGHAVQLTQVSVPSGLPGLHSYAWGQQGGKWLIIGGRKDGLHARQPFNAFPQAQNNTDIYVVDWAAGQTRGCKRSIVLELWQSRSFFGSWSLGLGSSNAG